MATSKAGRRAHVKRRAGGGFWQGAVAGAVVSAVIAAGLIYAFPPLKTLPPEIPPGSVEPPAVLTSPAPVAGRPAPAAVQGLLVEAPAPLVTTGPARDVPPGLDALLRPPAPDVFDGGAAGSPSLFRPGETQGDTPAVR